MRKGLLLLTALLALSAAAQGEEEGEVVVSAARVQLPVDAVGDDAVVITQEQIKRYGFTSIADVLKFFSGIAISSNGGPGQPTNVFLQGFQSKYVLVMIDGVPVYDPSTPEGNANFHYLDLSNVEKIEVIKGPQSALYGSEAVAGIINIITKEPKKKKFSLSLEGGKYKTFKENLYGALKLKNGFLSLSFENFKTNGFSATNSDSSNYDPDADGYRYKTGWFSFGWNPTDSVRITGNLKAKQGSADYDSSWTPGPDKNNFSNFFANLNLDAALSDSALLKVKFGSNSDYRDYDSISKFKGDVRYFSLQPVYYINQSLFVTGGVNYRQELAQFPDYHSANLRSLFAEVHGGYLGLKGTAAVRRDFHSSFGDKTTYKLSLAYDLGVTDTTLKATYGTGFRAPSLYQLYGIGGNPDLKAETSEGWTLGLTQRLSKSLGLKGQLSFTYFKHHVWNGIVADNFRWINNQKVLTEGAELGAKLKPLSFLELYGNYTHLRAKEFDGSSWKKLPRRPKFTYTLGFNAYYGKLSFSAWALHYSDREDVYYKPPQYIVKEIKTLGGFTTYNCYASYEVAKGVKLFAKGVNLTDKRYQLAYGYNAMGRALFVGSSFTF